MIISGFAADISSNRPGQAAVLKPILLHLLIIPTFLSKIFKASKAAAAFLADDNLTKKSIERHWKSKEIIIVRLEHLLIKDSSPLF